MKSTLQKLFLLYSIAIVVIFGFYPELSFALGGIENKDYILLAPVPQIAKGSCDFTDANSICTTDVSTFVQGIFKVVIGVASALAVLMVMYEGLQYIMTASEKNKTASKERIKEILLGLLLAISSVLILNLVDPAFTQFKFDLKKENSSTGGATLSQGEMTPEEKSALEKNLADGAAKAGETVADQVSSFNQELQQNKDDLEKLKTALLSAPESGAKTALENTIRDTQSRISISENLINQAAEVKRLTDSGSFTAAEAKLRDMNLYFDAQAKAWSSNSSTDLSEQRAEEAASIRSEGATRAKEVYLYYNVARLKEERP